MVKVNQSLTLLILAAGIVAGLTLWRIGLLVPGHAQAPAALEPEPPSASAIVVPHAEIGHPLDVPSVVPLGARKSVRR